MQRQRDGVAPSDGSERGSSAESVQHTPQRADKRRAGGSGSGAGSSQHEGSSGGTLFATPEQDMHTSAKHAARNSESLTLDTDEFREHASADSSREAQPVDAPQTLLATKWNSHVDHWQSGDEYSAEDAPTPPPTHPYAAASARPTTFCPPTPYKSPAARRIVHLMMPAEEDDEQAYMTPSPNSNTRVVVGGTAGGEGAPLAALCSGSRLREVEVVVNDDSSQSFGEMLQQQTSFPKLILEESDYESSKPEVQATDIEGESHDRMQEDDGTGAAPGEIESAKRLRSVGPGSEATGMAFKRLRVTPTEQQASGKGDESEYAEQDEEQGQKEQILRTQELEILDEMTRTSGPLPTTVVPPPFSVEGGHPFNMSTTTSEHGPGHARPVSRRIFTSDAADELSQQVSGLCEMHVREVRDSKSKSSAAAGASCDACSVASLLSVQRARDREHSSPPRRGTASAHHPPLHPAHQHHAPSRTVKADTSGRDSMAAETHHDSASARGGRGGRAAVAPEFSPPRHGVAGPSFPMSVDRATMRFTVHRETWNSVLKTRSNVIGSRPTPLRLSINPFSPDVRQKLRKDAADREGSRDVLEAPSAAEQSKDERLVRPARTLSVEKGSVNRALLQQQQRQESQQALPTSQQPPPRGGLQHSATVPVMNSAGRSSRLEIFAPPPTISRYKEDFEEIEEIGVGSFGRVYRCRRRIDGWDYAVKAIKRKIRGPSDRENVLREVYALAALVNNKHVLRYYSAWIEDELLYIQTEYLRGSSIVEGWKTGELVFDELEVCDLIFQIASGLHYMHSQKLVHLDIKPENLFRTSDGVYKIGDLGLTTFSEEADEHESSTPQIDLQEGDSRYLCQKVLNGDYRHLTKTDIFALALSAYELAHGPDFMLPCMGPTWRKIRNEGLDPVLGLSAEMNALLFQMAHPEPAQRPTALQLMQHPLMHNSLRMQRLDPESRAEFGALQAKVERLQKLLRQHGIDYSEADA
ncbi:Wee1-like protein kinase 1-B [Porphyridium purpureum]|uniref:Wee1-like protein kinase 1-B n=1 Tax=Porphyridium purpureum TaxID=35688 RepID=A0A5J4Z4B8_PORPP|nr:Wee1-like protein kinase 1-B [Porphyridium purpureum]|eukprot:POR7735..scf295_1